MPSITGTAKRNIIVVPCVVKSWLYRSGSRTAFLGPASCTRMSSARIPPSRKNTKAVRMNRRPMSLWSVDVSQPTNPGRRPQVRSRASISATSAADAAAAPPESGPFPAPLRRATDASGLFQALQVIEQRVHVPGPDRVHRHADARLDPLRVDDPARQVPPRVRQDAPE